jgi:hypothetical protein
MYGPLGTYVVPYFVDLCWVLTCYVDIALLISCYFIFGLYSYVFLMMPKGGEKGYMC